MPGALARRRDRHTFLEAPKEVGGRGARMDVQEVGRGRLSRGDGFKGKSGERQGGAQVAVGRRRQDWCVVCAVENLPAPRDLRSQRFSPAQNKAVSASLRLSTPSSPVTCEILMRSPKRYSRLPHRPLPRPRPNQFCCPPSRLSSSSNAYSSISRHQTPTVSCDGSLQYSRRKVRSCRMTRSDSTTRSAR